MKQFIKLSEWARLHDYTYHGAFGLFKRGGIKGAIQKDNGTILVETEPEKTRPEYNVVYARVSSSENKPNLESQAERVSQFCSAKGWVVHEVVKECASGLNDERPKLQKIFKERKTTRIIVEHKDRLTRFGFNYIAAAFHGCEIVVLNEVGTNKEGLIEDFISAVTSLFGKRIQRRTAEKLIENFEE